MSYEQRIIQMRKSNSYLLTIHQEALTWNLYLDEIIVLCDCLRILDQNLLAVSRDEVRKVFNKFYKKESHGDKESYLAWIYSSFHIKDQTRVFTSQVRKNTPLPQTSGGISGSNSHDFAKDELGGKSPSPKILALNISSQRCKND